MFFPAIFRKEDHRKTYGVFILNLIPYSKDYSIYLSLQEQGNIGAKYPPAAKILFQPNSRAESQYFRGSGRNRGCCETHIYHSVSPNGICIFFHP